MLANWVTHFISNFSQFYDCYVADLIPHPVTCLCDYWNGIRTQNLTLSHALSLSLALILSLSLSQRSARMWELIGTSKKNRADRKRRHVGGGLRPPRIRPPIMCLHDPQIERTQHEQHVSVQHSARMWELIGI